MVAHVIRALRESHPDLRISMLTSTPFHPLFNGLGVELITLDLKDRHKGFKGKMRLAKEISERGVDCVADLHGVGITVLISTLLRLRGISLKKINKGRFSKWMRMDGGCSDVTKPLKHTVVRYCDVVRRLGFKFEDPRPAVWVPRPNPLPFEKGDERWIGVAPFSAHEGKSYPKPLMQEVIVELSKIYDRVFIHSGGGTELSFAKDMEKLCPNVMAVFGAISLSEEIDLIANLDCVISMDSFIMHVASLTATPVVSVWGATHPSLGFSGYGCGTEGYVQQDLVCRPCSTFGNKHCRFGDYHCLADIPPSQIIEQVAIATTK